jgi:uncharacterized glyoxalase superfamily protein PhnB
VSQQDEQSTSIPGLVHGQFCHLQIPALDVSASARFYGQLFRWRVDPPASEDFEAPMLIGQWITDRPPAPDGGLVGWIHVTDVERTLVDAVNAGATVTMPATPDGPRVLAAFADPAGNVVGIVSHGGARPVTNRTMPRATVMPVLTYEDLAAAIDWLSDAFGFVERWRADDHRAFLEYEGGAIMLGGADAGPASAASVMVRVRQLGAHYDRARAHGVQITSEPRDYPYGERQYSAVDLAGHDWTFTQSITDVAPEEWGGTSGPALAVPPSVTER